MRLRIVHVTENLYGGLGTLVCNLVASQAADPRVEAVHLLYDPARLGDSDIPAATRLHGFKSSRTLWELPRVAHRVQSMLSEIAPDVVFLHSTFGGVYGRLLQPPGRGWATIYCAHGWVFLQRIGVLRRWAYAGVERWLSPRADAIISISDAEHQAATQTGIRPVIHRMVYHGLRPAATTSEPPIAIDHDRINLGFIGRFDRTKGVDRLLEAFDDSRLDHLTLWLIGANAIDSGPVLRERPNIRLIGPVPNAVIDDYIRCFDAVVMPSRSEGFGLAALEAMRNGRPVIASRVGGLGELVLEGRNGLFIEIDDLPGMRATLLRLTKSELRRMGDDARAFAAEFTWEKCYRGWQETMQEAILLHRSRSSAAAYPAPAPQL